MENVDVKDVFKNARNQVDRIKENIRTSGFCDSHIERVPTCCHKAKDFYYDMIADDIKDFLEGEGHNVRFKIDGDVLTWTECAIQ